MHNAVAPCNWKNLWKKKQAAGEKIATTWWLQLATRLSYSRSDSLETMDKSATYSNNNVAYF